MENEKTAIKQISEKKIDKIIEVTVYSDRVLVTRKIETTLDSNTNSIVFSDLPSNVIRDTIRVSGKGSAKTRVEGIDVRDEYLEEVKDEEILNLEKDLQELKDRQSLINSKSQFCIDEKTYLTSVKDSLITNLPSEFYYKKSTINDLSGYIDLFRGNFDRLGKENLELIKEQRELQKKISKIERELNDKKSQRTRHVINCYVAINVEKEGDFSFYLTYILYGAWWSPVYDARILFDTKEIELSYYGKIGQQTGEKWENVKIFLSTAKPSISASLPDLEPRFLDFEYVYDGIFNKGLSGGSSDKKSNLDDFEGSDQNIETKASVKKGLTATFVINENQSLPSDGTEKKVLILRKKFPVELDFRTYPRENEAVFIRGQFENTTEFPLLAGNVKVFHDQDYIGDSYLNNIIPKEKASLSLGVDESIKIKRELLKHFTQKKGVTGSNTKTIYKYRITLENYKKEESTVIVEESIPVSRNKELEVKLVEVSGKIVPDYKGILRWELKLKSNEKREIEIEFSVEYPKHKTVIGLDI